MITIREQLSSYALTYAEKPNQTQPELTEKDMLATIAVILAMKPCQIGPFIELDCSVDKYISYQENPDQFIKQQLGEAGSYQRKLNEDCAKQLFQIVQRFASSPALDAPNTAMQQELAVAFDDLNTQQNERRDAYRFFKEVQ